MFPDLRADKAMEAGVRQYEIPVRQIKLSLGQRCLLFIALVVILFGLRWFLEAAFHWEHRSLIVELIDPLVLSAAIAFGTFLKKVQPQTTTLILGEDFLETRRKQGWLTSTRRIRREKIRSVSENTWGLTVMDRGQFAARMLFGFVFVPASLPEYQQIKGIVMQWAGQKAPSSGICRN